MSDDRPPWKFKVNGMRNPVNAALLFVQTVGLPIDLDSFIRTSARVGDSDPETLADGFLVQHLSDLERLCNEGGFTVYVSDGVLCACLASEYEA
jgi:hypothetical protein